MTVKPERLLSSGWRKERIPRACIIGLGLIGGSWAGALHNQGWIVNAIDQNEDWLKEALERGWIKEGWSSLPAFLDADLIVLALPMQHLSDGLSSLSGRLSKGTIITDVGSVKFDVCLKASEFYQQGVYFVGGHPMTGSEKSGFKAADPRLFQGFPYVLTPNADCPEAVVNTLAKLIESFGASVIFRESEKHDTEAALISHIPHILSVTLALAANDLQDEGSEPLQLAGRSFRELTRIADSSPEMWREIMVNNAPAILKGLDLWQNRLKEIRGFVEQGNGEGIAEAFRKAHGIRQTMLDERDND